MTTPVRNVGNAFISTHETHSDTALKDTGTAKEQATGHRSDDWFDHVGDAVTHAKDEVVATATNLGGEAIGEIEELVHKPIYSVKHYIAPVGEHLTRSSLFTSTDEMSKAQQQYHLKGIVDLREEVLMPGAKEPWYTRFLHTIFKPVPSDVALAKTLGVNTLRIPIEDNTVPKLSQVVQFLDFATDPANVPCDVHCEAGKGRTGVMAACYEMAVMGVSPEVALAHAKQFGMGIPAQEEFISTTFPALLAKGKVQGKVHSYPLQPSWT